MGRARGRLFARRHRPRAPDGPAAGAKRRSGWRVREGNGAGASCAAPEGPVDGAGRVAEQRFSSADALIGALDEVGQRSSAVAPRAAGPEHGQEARRLLEKTTDKASESVPAERDAPEVERVPAEEPVEPPALPVASRDGATSTRSRHVPVVVPAVGQARRVARHGARVSCATKCRRASSTRPPFRIPAARRSLAKTTRLRHGGVVVWGRGRALGRSDLVRQRPTARRDPRHRRQGAGSSGARSRAERTYRSRSASVTPPRSTVEPDLNRLRQPTPDRPSLPADWSCDRSRQARW